jgi:hypothetical protein
MFIRLRLTFGDFDRDFVFDLIELVLAGLTAEGLRDFDRVRDFGFVKSYFASFSRFFTFLTFIWARSFLALFGVLDRLLLPTYFISDFFCLAGLTFLILLAFLELLLLCELFRELLLILLRFLALLLLLHELLLALGSLEELLIFLALLLILLLLALRFSFELLLRMSCYEEMLGGD